MRCAICGCGKRGAPAGFRRTLTPSVGPRSIQGGTAAGITPAQLRALGAQQATSPGEVQKLDEQRRRIEKLRREAVKKRLNK